VKQSERITAIGRKKPESKSERRKQVRSEIVCSLIENREILLFVYKRKTCILRKETYLK